jgi:predicted glycosyltransferase
MHVFVSIEQPDHGYLYHRVIATLEEQGHTVSVFTDRSIAVLERNEIPYTALDDPNSQDASEDDQTESSECRYHQRLLEVVRHQQPDVLTGIGGETVTRIGSLAGTRTVVFRDETSSVDRRITRFADEIHTPRWVDNDLGRNHYRYNGYQELAALEQFDAERLQSTGVEPEEPYSVLSTATDSSSAKETASETFSARVAAYLDDYGTVYRLAETGTDESDGRTVPVEARYDLLAAADLYVGSQPDHARVAGLSGTPTVCLTEATIPAIDHLEKYGLVDAYETERSALSRVRQLVPNPATEGVWNQRRRQLIEQTCDVVSYIVDALTDPPTQREPATATTVRSRSE